MYIARILACGAIIRVIPSPQLFNDSELFKGVIEDLVEFGKKRSTLLELAAPFLCHILNSKHMTEAIFEEVIWPAILPLFANLVVKTEKVKEEVEGDEEVVEATPEDAEEKDSRDAAALLLIALTCHDKGLKMEFEFLNDIDRVVRILLVRSQLGIKFVIIFASHGINCVFFLNFRAIASQTFPK